VLRVAEEQDMGANIRLAGCADARAFVGLLAEVAAENRWIRTTVPFDIARIELEVYVHNVAAIALYRAFGFVESGPPVSEERADGQCWQAMPMAYVFR
jgi:hypothetical protein